MLETLLGQGEPLLADGATGTNLFEMGLTSGDNPELWNVTHSDRILALHKSFVDAGADIILTNSFGGNRRRLMLHQLEGRTHELNRRAAEIARSAAAGAGQRVIVAGSVGPTGDLLAPLGPINQEEAFDVFVEQIEGLKEGGADVIWIETMSAPDEIAAAARAAGSLGPRHYPGAARRHRHRQGQCRNSAMAWRAHSLFRHARTDGRLCPIGARRRRAHHRRLLWFDRRPLGRHAPRDRRPQGRRPPTIGRCRRRARSACRPALYRPERPRAAQGLGVGEFKSQTARLDPSEFGLGPAQRPAGGARTIAACSFPAYGRFRPPCLRSGVGRCRRAA